MSGKKRRVFMDPFRPETFVEYPGIKDNSLGNYGKKK
jgi:hypothetical protein